MNFLDFQIDSSLKEELNSLEKQNKLPHAVILNGGNNEQRLRTAVFLSMWAVCSEKSNIPCGKCKACINAEERTHSDVYYAQGSGKTEIYNVDEIRKINADTVIKPNSAEKKVYIFLNADKRMPVISQNTFLKTLEEPPDNVLFILTTENSNMLLSTILSRATVFNIPLKDKFEEESLELAKNIVKGILKPSEIDLLFSTGKLNKKQTALDVLAIVSRLFRDGLSCSVGGKCTVDDECGRALAKRLTKSRLLSLIELNEKAIVKINQNVNLNLLATWLCGEYRRISWQK
ncbi:MAG: hypothetical protein PUD24_04645 [Oscillospiraceae bacterium]|nr:hypothetical protein [Oscillospiraceae bacterium]